MTPLDVMLWAVAALVVAIVLTLIVTLVIAVIRTARKPRTKGLRAVNRTKQ